MLNTSFTNLLVEARVEALRNAGRDGGRRRGSAAAGEADHALAFATRITPAIKRVIRGQPHGDR
jgi:hypothetical protein